MLNRLLFSRGGKKPITTLILRAASWRVKSAAYYGFNPSHGTLTPATIVYKGTAYTIAALYCRVTSSSASFTITMNTSVPFSTIRLRYNNVEYSISKTADDVFSKAGALWNNTGAYTLEILSIT